MSNRYIVAIKREQTEKLKQFIEDQIKIKPEFIMTEVIRLALEFALARDGEFSQFLKGKITVEEHRGGKQN